MILATFAFANFFSIQYCVAVPAERMQYCGARRHLTTHHSDPVSVEQATAKPIKDISKVTLRFAGA
jgi:hypothetical protein